MTEIKVEGGRVLVTGGSGFIGTHLIRLLQSSGFQVTNYDKEPPLDPAQSPFWREGNILDRDALNGVFNDFSPSHVVHLAARTDLDGESIDDYRDNTEGTRNVLEISDRLGSVRRVIVTSTMYVCRRGYNAASDDDYAVDTVYGQSKVETEEITRRGDWGFDWAIVRPAVIWGPYHLRLKREFFRILSMGLYFHPGNSRVRRSYGYVENTAWQMKRLLEVDALEMSRKTFYLADPPIDLYEWVNEFSMQLRGSPVRSIPMGLLHGVAVLGDMLKKIGIGFPLTSFRLANMSNDWVVDTLPVERVAGSVPISMKQGVARTVSWLQQVGS